MYNSVRHLKRPSVLTCGIASAEPSSNDGPNCNTVNTPQQHKRWDTFAIALLLTLLQFCFCYNISTALFMFRSFAGCVSTNVYLVCTEWRGWEMGSGRGLTGVTVARYVVFRTPVTHPRHLWRHVSVIIKGRSVWLCGQLPRSIENAPLMNTKLQKKSCGWREIRRVNGSKSRKNCIAGGQFRDLMLH